MSSGLKASLGLLASSALMAASVQAQVYTNNFDSAPGGSLAANSAFTGTGGLGTTIGAYTGFGRFYRGESASVATELLLTSLPTHTGVSMSYILGFMDSWDSRNGGCCSPDNLDVYIDGVKKFSYTYNNALGTIKDVGAGTVLYQYVQFDTNQFYSDTIADMGTDPGYTFAHSGSSLSVRWIASGAGWQGGGDEGYGLDNIRVELTGVVPEPSTYAMLALGLAGLAGMARRRRGY